jgi:hypothetical protein
MSSDLFLRLPAIWARLDSEGVLERYLSVWDSEFDRISDFVLELLASRNIDRADDRFIQYKGDAVGHEFDVMSSDTTEWNRSRISVAVTRHAFKGTWAEIDDLVERHGGLEWDSVDMMSQILVPGSQGYPGSTASYLIGPTLYHPGARKLIVDTNLDLPGFLEDFLPTRAAGEIWYIYIDDGNGVETPYIY